METPKYIKSPETISENSVQDILKKYKGKVPMKPKTFLYKMLRKESKSKTKVKSGSSNKRFLADPARSRDFRVSQLQIEGSFGTKEDPEFCPDEIK